MLGDNNMVSTNLFSFEVSTLAITPAGATPTMVLVVGGDANVISNNHMVTNTATNHVQRRTKKTAPQ